MKKINDLISTVGRTLREHSIELLPHHGCGNRKQRHICHRIDPELTPQQLSIDTAVVE